jgi:tripartite-type tricarboxylate transporter receptor subunit TctC
MTGMKMVHVPYNSGPLPGLIANQIQLQMGPIPSSIQYVKNGQLLALGVSSLTPDPTLPGVPTITEFVPGYEVSEWPSLVAPAGTPNAVIERLHQEIVRVLATPDIKQKLEQMGSQAVGSTPQELGTYIKQQIATWSKIAADLKATGSLNVN